MAKNTTELDDALQQVLLQHKVASQVDIRQRLEALGYEVNQSTISRALKRVGAIRLRDAQGQPVYRLEAETTQSMSAVRAQILSVESNGAMLVMRTTLGAAGWVARQLDLENDPKILGTIAGDDTIFIAPASALEHQKTLDAVIEMIRTPDE